MALTDKLTAIANAIREKDGTSDKMALAEMPSKIAAIQVGGATEPYTEETYDANGNLISATLHGYTSIRARAFKECLNLASISLPSGLTSIGNDVFNGCSNLALTSLPSSLTSIGVRAFEKCSSLTSITFEGTPSTIDSSAFTNCTKLTTINVPWAEGAVAGAPWGATNATINYNYTGA